jgi:hypothetical protein
MLTRANLVKLFHICATALGTLGAIAAADAGFLRGDFDILISACVAAIAAGFVMAEKQIF